MQAVPLLQYDTSKIVTMPKQEEIYAVKTQADALWQDVRTSRAALNASWIAHHKAVMAYKQSGAWKAKYRTWKECCIANPDSLFAASTYRAYAMELPLSELIESTTQATLSANDSRKLRENIASVIEDESEKALIPSIWQLAHEYEKQNNPEAALVPRKDSLQAAYIVLKEEQLQNTVSVDGKTFDLRRMAQVASMRETIISGYKDSQDWERRTVAIDGESKLKLILDTLGLNLPMDKVRNIQLVYQARKEEEHANN